MAIFEKTIRNKNFDELLWKLEKEIPDSSWSADLEAGSDFKEGNTRCSVRVFERYSMMGGNRLSLTLTMFQNALVNPKTKRFTSQTAKKTEYRKATNYDNDSYILEKAYYCFEHNLPSYKENA